MRTSNLHFLIITLACILFACKDNNDIEPDANDAFVGSQRLITLSSEMDKFSGTDFECVIKAEDGTIFRRRGNHIRSGNTSLLTLDTGLRTGTYRLLALEVPTIENGTDTVWTDYGLGCRVRISAENHSATVLDTFNLNLLATVRKPILLSFQAPSTCGVCATSPTATKTTPN